MKKRLTLLTQSATILAMCSLTHAEEKKPNIILIMADDIGIECFGSYGGDAYKTPNIDQLAEEGIRFTHAYAQPLCTPTRLEIMTGQDNHRNWKYFGILRPESKTFGHMMQERGYETCMVGKWQLQSYDPPEFPNAAQRRGTGMHPSGAGFDEYLTYHSAHTEDKGSRYADPTYEKNGVVHKELKGEYGEDHSVEYLLDFLKRHKDKATFSYFPMALPHWPMNPTPISEDWKDPAKRLLEDTKYFPDMVEYMDILVGKIVDGVEQLGIRDNTIIIFYSDNGTDGRIVTQYQGEAIKGGKNQTIQSGIRVPLIINCPKKISPKVVDGLIESSDFLPTLADLSGEPLNPGWYTDGVSFAPVIEGKANPQARDSAFFWYDPRPGWDKEKFTRSIFALDHKYKLFRDGRFYHIEGLGLREEPLDMNSLSAEAKDAHKKLKDVIKTMMQGPISLEAQVEVDSFGHLIE